MSDMRLYFDVSRGMMSKVVVSVSGVKSIVLVDFYMSILIVMMS
ncbi:MAG: hypothetical protein PHD21_02310 [Flavobacteriales bacterium]|nr:hypothetical protein [Flavobacteriales bacterium]